MIPDYEKNAFAIADVLRRETRVGAALAWRHGAQVLRGCRDIWCRDFMPIQTDSGFVQFLYAPQYLADDPDEWPSITIPGVAYPEWMRDGVPVQQVPLVVDGGSIVGDHNVALVSGRVAQDNPDWNALEIKAHLRRILEVQRVLYVPPLAPGDDFTGHLDGSIRIVAPRKLVVGVPPKDQHAPDKPLLRRMQRHAELLKDIAGRIRYEVIELVDVSYRAPVAPDGNVCGNYANFLQLGPQRLLVPRWDLPEDRLARQQLEQAGFEVILVGASEFADPKAQRRAGGAINCVTWNWASSKTGTT